MRMLIYGSGQLAAGAVRDLTDANPDNQITVLGKDRNELERLSAYPGVSVVLLTEPVMQNYRLDAGIDHVNAFLALSDNDHENLMLAQIARYMFNVRHVVCHVENPPTPNYVHRDGPQRDRLYHRDPARHPARHQCRIIRWIKRRITPPIPAPRRIPAPAGTAVARDK